MIKKFKNPIVALENKVEKILEKIEQKDLNMENRRGNNKKNSRVIPKISISDSQKSQEIENKENEEEKISKKIIQDHFLEQKIMCIWFYRVNSWRSSRAGNSLRSHHPKQKDLKTTTTTTTK